MTHSKKDCVEKPRKRGAKYTGKDFKDDELIQAGSQLTGRQILFMIREEFRLDLEKKGLADLRELLRLKCLREENLETFGKDKVLS